MFDLTCDVIGCTDVSDIGSPDSSCLLCVATEVRLIFENRPKGFEESRGSKRPPSYRRQYPPIAIPGAD